MSNARKLGAATLAAAIVAMLALTACGRTSRSADGVANSLAATKPISPVSAKPCGMRASTAAIAGVDRTVAERIYTGELASHETSIDVAHVTGYRELLSALAKSNRRAVYAAVHRIVYTPHWHIVRLRVSSHGRVLADVGGPRIIAPVYGTLRFKGRDVGRFELSVQDDLGYMKLVTRFIGLPIDIYAGGSFVMGTLQPAPSSVATGEVFDRAGVTYRTLVLHTLAFPTGTLRVALFIPVPARALAAHGCEEVRASAWIDVISHIATRFNPLATHYGALLGTLRGSTGGLGFVREGARVLAGRPDPKTLPQNGRITFEGHSWSVSSWPASRSVRVYLLTSA